MHTTTISMTTLESLSANQNPPNLKDLQRLQQQTTQLQCMLIIHKTSLCVVVDANIVIVIQLASLMLPSFVCDIWVSPEVESNELHLLALL